jgi:hypothetical protein
VNKDIGHSLLARERGEIISIDVAVDPGVNFRQRGLSYPSAVAKARDAISALTRFQHHASSNSATRTRDKNAAPPIIQ